MPEFKYDNGGFTRRLLPITTEDGQTGPMQGCFERFHRLNPHVLRTIEELVEMMRERGVTQWGMKGVFEVLRWQYAMQTGGEAYKLNNNYTAFYVRVVVGRYPNLDGFFKMRKQALGYVVDWSALGLKTPAHLRG